MKKIVPYLILFGVALLFLWAILTAVAHAQDVVPVMPAPSTWNGLAMQVVFMVCSATVTGLIGWMAMWVKAKYGIEIEARHREALHSAVMTGVSAALRKIVAQGGQTAEKRVVIQETLEWVQKSVPDALKAFNIDGHNMLEMLEPIIEAKLNIIADGTVTPRVTVLQRQ